MGVLDNIINFLKHGEAEEDSSSSSTQSDEQNEEETEQESQSSETQDGQNEAMGRELAPEREHQAYIDGLKRKDELTLNESLAIGLEETKLTGVTKEQVASVKIQQEAQRLLDGIDGIEIDKSPNEIGAAPATKAHGFEPDRGQSPSAPSKKNPNN